MNYRYLLVLIPVFVLLTIGCLKTADIKYTGPSPNDWRGESTIDPCGDLATLQGKWSYVSSKKIIGQPSEIDLTFKGSTANYDYITIQKAGGDPKANYYKIIINSSVEPKILRFTEWTGPVGSTPIMHPPEALWYKIEGEILTTWDAYSLKEESAPTRYKRSDPNSI